MIKTSHKIILLLMAVFFSFNLNAKEKKLVINEIMPANVSYMLDGTYNYGGWIELYNDSEETINLAGYSISDTPANPTKYTFPENIGEIASGEYKIIFFDNYDLDKKQVNFKLDCDGAILYLYNNKKLLKDFVEYGYAYPGTSYAREYDADTPWATCITPTPGRSNDGSEFSIKRAEKPRASIQPKVFNRTIMLLLSSADVIRYTTDGTEPTENSEIWSGKKAISSTTVIRARAYRKGYIPSEILTCTYIIEREHTIDLPVISIVTDPENLWSDSIGIYCVGTNGISGNGISYNANWNRDWRRPANIEIINNPHDNYISQQCDIGIGGGWSRAYPLKSIEINAEKKYEGKNSFDTRIFAQKPYYRFKSLNLRNSGNDFYSSMMWDAAQQCLYANITDVEYQAYQPAVHYINGEYYGIINIRERSNHHHAYSNWGYDKENLNMVMNSASGNTITGDKTKLKRLEELIKTDVNDAAYKEICEIIDIDEFINYIVIQSFAGNGDWMSNNVKFYSSQNHDGRYRWVLFDLDGGFKNLNYNQFTASDRSGLTNTKVYTGQIFQALKKHAAFRKKFVSHATAIIGGSIRPARVNSIIDSIASLISNEMPRHRERWGNSYNLDSYRMSFKDFGKKRPMIYATQLAEYFSLGAITKVNITPQVKTALYIDDIEVPTGVFDGYLHPDQNPTFHVDVPYGYKFKTWKVIKTSGLLPEASGSGQNRKPNYNTPVLKVLLGNGQYNITAEFEKIDTLYGHLVPAVRINEIGANKEITRNDYFEKSDWVELYNLTDTIVDIAGLYISNNEEMPKMYRIPDTDRSLTRIPPHGHCILWADEENDNRELHLPFKLSSSGGRLILSAYCDKDSMLLWRDEIVFTPHDDDRSFGRYPDGSDKLHLMHRPTPRTTNLYSSYNKFVANDTVTGYQINETTSINSIITGNRTAIKTTYYKLSGEEINATFDELPTGIYIRRTIYDNCDVESEKIYKR